MGKKQFQARIEEERLASMMRKLGAKDNGDLLDKLFARIEDEGSALTVASKAPTKLIDTRTKRRIRYEDWDEALNDPDFQALIKEIGYDGPLERPWTYTKPTFGVDRQRYHDPDRDDRFRELTYPVGFWINTMTGIKPYEPWFVPQCRLKEYWEHIKLWREESGADFYISAPLYHDFCGNGTDFGPNNRAEPACVGDVLVWAEVKPENAEKLQDWLDLHKDIPCFLKINIADYNASHAMEWACEQWNTLFVYYYREGKPKGLFGGSYLEMLEKELEGR